MRSFLRKWGLCLLLLLATTLNYLDRQTVSILAPILQDEMKFDNEALGWLFSVFYYSYTFAQLGVGLLLDRFSVRWLYGGAVLAWSATCALTGLSNGFAALLGFRLLLGITESANWPGAMRIVSRVLPPAERAMGNGIFTSGTSIGALIAPGLILAIAAWAGWRMAFAVLGSLGIFWFLAWSRATSAPAYSEVWKPEPVGPAQRSPFETYRLILRDPQFWRVFAVTILVNPCLYFYLNWLPTYFRQAHQLEPQGTMAPILTALYLGLDLGYLFCGAGVILLVRRGAGLPSARRFVFLLATALLGCSAIAATRSELSVVVGLLIVCNFAIGIWIAMYLTMAQEVNLANVSTAAGLLGGSGSLAGALAMWAVGRVTRQTGSFAIPLTAVTICAVLAAIAGWASSNRRAKQAC
jgi:ACS family hexuronate transporter-like MFS transporter